MAFFARPNLDNTQFKQLKGGEPLTLSGQTQIATTSGLTLYSGTTAGGVNMYIPIIATGASNNFVLTYDDTQQAIVLKQSTASGGTTVYPYNECSTCTVGGLVAPDNLYNRQVVDILHDILVPTMYPTLTNPSLSLFTINPTTTLYEVGVSSDITGTTCFNPGSIDPVYPPTACSCRSNGTLCYEYSGYVGTVECTINSPSNVYPFGGYSIQNGNNTISAKIYYSGGTQPYNSTGGTTYSGGTMSGLTTGITNTCSKTITGVYPWFWGTGSTVPDVSTSGCTQCLIDSYTCKCVASSVNNVVVDNFNVTAKYIWFATPYASTTKTCWQGANNVSNNGVIPGPLFPAPTSWNIGSCSNCWGTPTSPVGLTTPVCYKVYVSNYATNINYGMTFCN